MILHRLHPRANALVECGARNASTFLHLFCLFLKIHLLMFLFGNFALFFVNLSPATTAGSAPDGGVALLRVVLQITVHNQFTASCSATNHSPVSIPLSYLRIYLFISSFLQCNTNTWSDTEQKPLSIISKVYLSLASLIFQFTTLEVFILY